MRKMLSVILIMMIITIKINYDIHIGDNDNVKGN